MIDREFDDTEVVIASKPVRARYAYVCAGCPLDIMPGELHYVTTTRADDGKLHQHRSHSHPGFTCEEVLKP